MDVCEFPGCCAAVIIQNFYNYDTSPYTKKQQILYKIKEYLKDYIKYDTEYPTTFYATTNTNEQLEWEKALQEIGFKARKFRSRHDKGTTKSLNFWSLYSIPKELKPFIKEQLKLQKQRIKDDNW